MNEYMVTEYGLSKFLKYGLWKVPETLISAEPKLKLSENYYIFEAPDDDTAKLIYEVGGYE